MINLNAEDMAKLKRLVSLGVTTKQEVKDLNDSLKETLDEVTKDLDLDKKIIRKAISLAFKASQKGDKDQLVEEERDTLDEVSALLDTIGKM